MYTRHHFELRGLFPDEQTSSSVGRELLARRPSATVTIQRRRDD